MSGRSNRQAGDVNTNKICEDACYKCNGGEWRCQDFKTSTDVNGTVSYKCNCAKKR